MEKNTISCESIVIPYPSQLVLQAEELFQLRKKLPPHDETLEKKEQKILSTISEKKTQEYESLLFFAIDYEKIAATINNKFQDGISLEDDIVHYPFDRTIRTKPLILEDPTKIKEKNHNGVGTIKIGKHRIIEENSVSLKRFNTSLLAFSDTFESASVEENHRRR